MVITFPGFIVHPWGKFGNKSNITELAGQQKGQLVVEGQFFFIFLFNFMIEN